MGGMRSSILQQKPIHVARTEWRKASRHPRRLLQNHHHSKRRQRKHHRIHNPKHPNQAQTIKDLPNHHPQNRIPNWIEVLNQSSKRFQCKF